MPRVTITVGGDGQPAVSPASGAPPRNEPPAPFGKACLACHGDDVIRQQRLTRAQWDAELTKMTGWGARISEQDRGALLDYLAASFGVRP